MLYFDHFLRHITSSYHVNSILAEGKRHQTGTGACLGLTTSIIDVVSREPKKASSFGNIHNFSGKLGMVSPYNEPS